MFELIGGIIGFFLIFLAIIYGFKWLRKSPLMAISSLILFGFVVYRRVF